MPAAAQACMPTYSGLFELLAPVAVNEPARLVLVTLF